LRAKGEEKFRGNKPLTVKLNDEKEKNRPDEKSKKLFFTGKRCRFQVTVGKVI
jgi:hypothetical protein